MSNIQLDIEWTEAASRKIEKLMPRNAKDKDAYLALPPVECLPMEGDVLFLGPDGKQQPFIVAERQYHHDGDADGAIQHHELQDLNGAPVRLIAIGGLSVTPANVALYVPDVLAGRNPVLPERPPKPSLSV